MKKAESLISLETVAQQIYFIRGQRVMLDSDLAVLYGVETKFLIRAMKRNANRFPEDFMFQLTTDEFASLRYQIGTSKSARGGRRYPPYVFTEHGAVMLASVLNSPRAVEASIFVVRAFVRLRELISTHREIAKKLSELEHKISGHDSDIQALFEAIRQLMQPPERTKRQIGFKK